MPLYVVVHHGQAQNAHCIGPHICRGAPFLSHMRKLHYYCSSLLCNMRCTMKIQASVLTKHRRCSYNRGRCQDIFRVFNEQGNSQMLTYGPGMSWRGVYPAFTHILYSLGRLQQPPHAPKRKKMFRKIYIIIIIATNRIVFITAVSVIFPVNLSAFQLI